MLFVLVRGSLGLLLFTDILPSASDDTMRLVALLEVVFVAGSWRHKWQERKWWCSHINYSNMTTSAFTLRGPNGTELNMEQVPILHQLFGFAQLTELPETFFCCVKPNKNCFSLKLLRFLKQNSDSHSHTSTNTPPFFSSCCWPDCDFH